MSEALSFADAEIIKAKLEALQKQLDRIEGHFESLMAAIEGRKNAPRG